MLPWFKKLNREYRLDRRELLRLGALGVLAPSVSMWFPSLVAKAAEEKRVTGKKPKACILLWMSGGPSQVHTFNLPTEGPHQEYQSIETAVSGIRISEYLPKLAAQMKDMALIRSMSTGINDHGGGHYLMHMGFRASRAIDYPSIGSIVAKELRQPNDVLPGYVCIGAGNVPTRPSRSGFLGAEYSPLMVAGKGGIQNVQPAVRERTDERAALLQEVEANLVERYQADIFHAHQTSYRQALDLMRSDKTKAFDLSTEPAKLREAYGSGFGETCLLARRLVEAGVSFVEVTWGGHSGAGNWDTHGGGARPIKERSPQLDAALATLIQDLKDRELNTAPYGSFPGDALGQG